MTKNVLINGFGRIGRRLLRAFLEEKNKLATPIAVNASCESLEKLAYFLKYDSIHGTFSHEIKIKKDGIECNDIFIKLISARDPSDWYWQREKIDIVAECTGAFNSKEASLKHIDAGAKAVIISAPAKNVDATIVRGINDKEMKNKEYQIFSCSSCTTNCLAPVLKVLNDNFNIDAVQASTIHAYTNDQRILDSNHKDLRRSRACNMSIIPSSTGASSNIIKVIPELQGKIDVKALRVPVANVSIAEITFLSSKPLEVNSLNEILIKSANGPMKNIIEICDQPLVSSDFIGNRASAIVDTTLSIIVMDKLCKISAWYDNETGFSFRMKEIIEKISEHSN